MYLGSRCCGYALNGHIVYLAIQESSVMHEKPIFFVLLYATTKKEIQICSNKHETCLVFI